MPRLTQLSAAAAAPKFELTPADESLLQKLYDMLHLAADQLNAVLTSIPISPNPVPQSAPRPAASTPVPTVPYARDLFHTIKSLHKLFELFYSIKSLRATHPAVPDEPDLPSEHLTALLDHFPAAMGLPRAAQRAPAELSQ